MAAFAILAIIDLAQVGYCINGRAFLSDAKNSIATYALRSTYSRGDRR
jgi:hypothetical protein